MSEIEKQLKAMGLALPEAVTPSGNFLPAKRVGNLVFLSGTGPRTREGAVFTGKVGQGLTVVQGQEAARLTTLRLLANLKGLIGDLDKVTNIVKVFGMVQCDPDFSDFPVVFNGCSDLLIALYGERGRHARTTMGVNTNPLHLTVSIDMVVEVGD